MPSAAEYLESLSPWPQDGFGLDRIRALLAELGDPQLRFPATHVVGTNGKTSVTRMTEALLAAGGLAVGAYTSPHVRGWSERIRVRGGEADLDRAIARVRPAAERLGATQFEVLTAAALAEFAEAGVDAAVVEAGLGGRHDATNVLRSRVVVLTNVALEHVEVLGTTREAIAAEKLAVVQPGSVVVLGEPEWRDAATAAGAARVDLAARTNVALAVVAAEAFLGRPVAAAPAQAVRIAGRLERRSDDPLEVWDGAHNLAGVGHVLARLPTADYTIVASILADKDVDGMLAAFAAIGRRLVATTSTNDRALSAADLAERARPYFEHVEAVPDPAAALTHARAGGGPVLVTGSLYLLADLASAEQERDLPCETLATN